MILAFACFSLYVLFSFWIIHSIFSIQSNYYVFMSAGLLLIGLLVLVNVLKEVSYIKNTLSKTTFTIRKEDFYTLVAVIGGAYLTFLFNHTADIGGVLASSMVGIVSAWTIRKYSLPIYCGSFIGMACNEIFSNPLTLGLASIITGILFVLSSHVFKGWGGKAGFLAFVGTYTTAMIVGKSWHIVEPLDSKMYLFIFISAVASGLATFSIQSMDKMDVVSASALVGLTIGVLSPIPSHTIVLSAFCGTFTGMTSKEQFSDKKDIIIATFITAFLFVAAFSLFNGSGGKLGALAFISSIATGGFKQLLTLFNKQSSLSKKFNLSKQKTSKADS